MKHPLIRIFAPIAMVISIAAFSAAYGTAEALQRSDGGRPIFVAEASTDRDLETLVAAEAVSDR